MRVFTLLLIASGLSFAQIPKSPAPNRPKLVLLIAVDQLRYDYLTRFRDEYKGGFDKLLRSGANYVNAHLEHYPTVTAVGHSTMMSGATPNISGIIGNDWYDRATGKTVTSVSDDATRLLGAGDAKGSSPRRLLVSTIGDEMKRARRDAPKVIGISMKDRSAILPSGHMADAAYWFDNKTGTFVSSTYYFPALPDWVQAFNQSRSVDKYAGVDWTFDKSSSTGTLKMPATPGADLGAAVYKSPFGNEILLQFIEEAIRREKIGQRAATDLLTVSFSSNDAVGHEWGPDSPQVHDTSIRTDALLAKFFASLDRSIGMQNVLVILTADHGVSPVPEDLIKDKMPGGRLPSASLFDPMEKALADRYGGGKWVLSTAGSSPYLNWPLISAQKLNAQEVEQTAADAIAQVPQVSRVFTRHQLTHAQVTVDQFSQRVIRSFHTQRSGDLEILLDPNWLRSTAEESKGTTHGAPYSYDSHIPLIFMGPGIKPGRYVRNVALNDLAASLATMLDIETPSGCVGQPLHEMMSFSPFR